MEGIGPVSEGAAGRSTRPIAGGGLPGQPGGHTQYAPVGAGTRMGS